MNNFTVCNNRNTWPALRQKRITSLTERMKSFTPPGRFIMLFLLCLLMTGKMAAQISRVQYQTGSTGWAANTSFTVTLAKAPANGNTLIAVISTRGSSANQVSSITQSGATWTRVVQASNASGSTTEIWYASNITNAVTAVKINLASLRAAAVVMEYSGILTPDVSASVPNNASLSNNSTPSTGTTITTTQDNEVWIGGISVPNSVRNLTGIYNDFNTIDIVATTSTTSSNNTKLYALEKIVDYTQKANSGGRLDAAAQWSGAIATFKKSPTIPRVQTATGNTGSSAASSINLALGSIPKNGNTLIAVISTRGNADSRVSKITQTNVTNWNRVVQSTNSSGVTTEIWYAPVTSTNAETAVTINLASSLRAAAVVMEYSGILTVSPVDQTAYASGNDYLPITGPTPMTTHPNELWIGGIGLSSSDTKYNLNEFSNYFSMNANVASTNSNANYNAKVYALEKYVTTNDYATTGSEYYSGNPPGSIPSINWSGAIATFKTPINAIDAAPYCYIAGTSTPIGWTNTLFTGAGGSVTTVPVNITAISRNIYDGIKNTAPIDVYAGGNITINPTSNNGFSNLNCFIYVDWDKDNVFEYLGQATGDASSRILNVVVPVPAPEKYGTTRVRVMFSKDATASPCSITNTANAMVCDFNIKIKKWCPPDIVGRVKNESCPEVKDGAITVDNVKAIEFKNTEKDYIDFGQSLMNNLSEFTLECWVKFKYDDNKVLSGDRTSGGIIGQNDAVELFISNGNKIQLWTTEYDFVDIDLNKHSIGNNVWHHIAGVGERSTLKVYVDGKLVGTQSNANNYPSYGNTTYKTRLGGFVSTDFTNVLKADDASFNGFIAKAGFWNKAFTASEIATLAENFHTYTTSDNGLLAGYNCFEEKGTVINGISTVSTAPTGTFKNSPAWTNIFPSWCISTKDPTKTPFASNTNFITGLIGDSSPDPLYHNYTVHIQGITCAEKTKDFLVDIDYTCPNVWVGTNGTEWNEKYNWKGKFVPFAEDEDPKRITSAKYGSIPQTAKNLVFATTANNTIAAQNDLILDKKRSVCGDFTNESNKALIIPPDKSLTIKGTATSKSVDRILIQANATQPNGSLIFTDPSKNPAVKATVQMYTRGFKGTDLWTWTDPAGGKYSGYYRWQFFGVPVKITDILYNNSLLWGSYIRKYEENKNLNSYYQKWTDVGNNDKLTAFTGYEITQPAAKAISFQGELVTGDQPLTLTKSTGTGTLNYGSGYNIFGNSFTAAIDISKIKFPDTGVEKTVYLYNTGSLADWGNNGQTLQTEGGTGFVGSYYSIPQKTSPVIGKEIPSMQGFLLKTTTNGAQVTIPYSTATGISATSNTTLQKTMQAAHASGEFSYMTVDVTGAGGVDRVWLFSQPETSHRFDNGWDGEKILLATGVVLYADEETGKYQVNTAADLDETYLAFRAGNETDYTLKIDKKNLNGYETLYLQDLMTGTEINLSAVDTASYQFTASNGQNAEKRFVLTRRSKTAIDNDRESLLTIYSAGNSILLNNRSDAAGVAGVYDLTGKQLYSAAYQPKQLKRLELNLPEGVYMVKAKSEAVNAVRRILIGGKR